LNSKQGQNIELAGISVSDGIGIGHISIYHTDLDDVYEYTLDTGEITNELERYTAALNEVDYSFLSNQKKIARELGGQYAEIYEAYHLILEDPFFTEEIPESIRESNTNAEAVIKKKLAVYEKHFNTVKDEYLRERIFDIRGVSRRVIFHLLQSDKPLELSDNKANVIFARELTPADSIHFHHRYLSGIVTEFGGKTSHAAILSRSIEVPAIVGVPNLLKQAVNDDIVIVDAAEGRIIIRPDSATLAKFREKRKLFLQRQKKLFKIVDKPIDNLGDRKIKLLANINETSEIDLAKKYHADGIGLFRTEFSFIAKETFLPEEEQLSLYKRVLKTFPDQEVVIRVLDLGGYKFLPFSELHRENNPFLGWRSIRILLSETEIFKTQLRALYRASMYGNVKILIPMISSREEIVATKEICSEVCNELNQKGIPFKENIPFGMMVEVPSTAVLIDELIEEVDFISIGTNDLIQYTLAVERNNEKVADFYQPLNPAILKLIQQIARAGKKHDKTVSVCGEMAGDPLYTQLLLGLGVDQLSMHPAAIPLTKHILLQSNVNMLDELAGKIFSFKTVKELRSYLAGQLQHIL